MSSDHIINCIIIDDEPLAQDVIEQHLSRFPFMKILDRCSNAMAAFESLHRHQVDVIFLDINMPVINGLNFLKSLHNPPLVIFTTAYPEYAIEGFELDAVDYLMKPIAPERMDKAIEKVASRLNKAHIGTIGSKPITSQVNVVKDYFFVKANNKIVKINFAELMYCEGMKDYIKLHMNNGKYHLVHHTMKYMEETLPNAKYIRIHKSYIISIDHIRAIVDNCVMLGDEQISIPVSATYKDALHHIIKSS